MTAPASLIATAIICCIKNWQIRPN